jgi:hypothetical protein
VNDRSGIPDRPGNVDNGATVGRDKAFRARRNNLTEYRSAMAVDKYSPVER